MTDVSEQSIARNLHGHNGDRNTLAWRGCPSGDKADISNNAHVSHGLCCLLTRTPVPFDRDLDELVDVSWE